MITIFDPAPITLSWRRLLLGAVAAEPVALGVLLRLNTSVITGFLLSQVNRRIENVTRRTPRSTQMNVTCFLLSQVNSCIENVTRRTPRSTDNPDNCRRCTQIHT